MFTAKQKTLLIPLLFCGVNVWLALSKSVVLGIFLRSPFQNGAIHFDNRFGVWRPKRSDPSWVGLSADTVPKKNGAIIMPKPCGDCDTCKDPDPKVRKKKGCLTNKAAKTSTRISEVQSLTASGRGGRVRACEPAWAHEEPADTKRPRLATGAYDSLHDLNRALFDATESLAA